VTRREPEIVQEIGAEPMNHRGPGPEYAPYSKLDTRRSRLWTSLTEALSMLRQ
jgi:hypothetical protein